MEPDDEDLWPLFADLRRRGRPDRDSRDQRAHERVRDITDHGRKPSRRVRGLSRGEIVRAAIKVADAEGAEAISMRRIARELNAGAMSLYWHVASKDELLDLMQDAVEGEQQMPEPTGDWRTDLRAMALAQRAALHRHQWLMDFIGGRPPLGPNTLRNMDRALAAIDTLGLGTETALNVLSAIGTYVVGAVLREFRESKVQQRDEEVLARMTAGEALEILTSHVERLRATGRFPFFLRVFDEGIDPDAEETRDARFEFGLDCVLDGIAARLLPGARASSATDPPARGSA
jgi:AcrR family transcriptional regulator